MKMSRLNIQEIVNHFTKNERPAATAKDICEKNNISLSVYYQWKHTLNGLNLEDIKELFNTKD